MASEHFKCKAELPITETEEAEIEQIALGSYFVDINYILNRGIKKEATDVKQYEVSDECPKNNENGKFYDINPDSSKFEVPLRDCVEDSTESKCSPAHFWENKNFNGLAGELSKINHFYEDDILKKEDEDHSECNDDSLTNNVESKMKTLKNKDDIDVIYQDVKPEICEKEASGKSENGSYPNSFTDILIRTEIGSEIGPEIGPNFSHKLSIDSETWPQQNIEENGTAMGRKHDKRKESTRTVDLKNYQIFQIYPLESKQEFKKRPHTREKPFQCKSCSKSFTTKYNLSVHDRSHTGEKPFECKFCSKSFMVKTYLTAHERIHTGEKEFQCKFCPKSFFQKGNLTGHERIHTGEKPFHCKVCRKSFAHRNTLLNHERIHTGETPFECKFCSKSFMVKRYLMEHEIIHTGEKPFHCRICSKAFGSRGCLSRHKLIHTGERSFQCKICTKSFSRKDYLTVHERIHTGEKTISLQSLSKELCT